MQSGTDYRFLSGGGGGKVITEGGKLLLPSFIMIFSSVLFKQLHEWKGFVSASLGKEKMD